MTLRVKLEIVPFGQEEFAREIGRLDIFNKAEIDLGVCSYGIIDLTYGREGLFDAEIVHNRSDGAEVLVEKVLSYINNLKIYFGTK